MLKITHSLGQMLVKLVDIKVTDNFCNKFIFSLFECQFISKEREGISGTVGLDYPISTIPLAPSCLGLPYRKTKQVVKII